MFPRFPLQEPVLELAGSSHPDLTECSESNLPEFNLHDRKIGYQYLYPIFSQ
jgi:hypothetical protein